MTLSVADRLELSDLVHRYAAYVDARRFDEVAELFTSTGQLVVPQPPERLDPCLRHDGRAGVRAAMAALDGVTRTQHAIAGELYTGSGPGDSASGAITGAAHHWIDSHRGPTDSVWYLRYADQYRRTATGWRIVVRELTIDAIEDRPARAVRP